MRFNCVVFLSVLLIIVSITIFGQSSLKSENIISINKLIKTQLDSIAPDHTGMRYLTSAELSKEMIPGWNVGNSLEAITPTHLRGDETAWGNPKITQRLIDSIKAAGFNSIRIPVAWSDFTDTTNYTIDTTWLNRVEEVVNYVLKDSLYAIINEHWDDGWIIPTYAKQEYVNNRLAAMWKQIAVHFRDYNDHLLFAGTNEVMYPGDYGIPKKEYYTVQNSYNQTFVNTVRSTGGRNYYRYLLVQGFNTNIDHTNNYFVMPADIEDKRLMVEVHYYDPWEFTIRGDNTITQWGKYVTDPKKTVSYANESYADGQFKKMKTKFVDKGYAVILGEYGAMARINLGSITLNDEYARFRQYYTAYITGSIFKHGLIPFYWDNGGTVNYGMGIFNRSTGTKAYPDIVKAIIDAVDTTNVTGMIDPDSAPTNFSLLQNYPNPFNPTTTISYSLPKTSSVTLKVFDVLGREVDTLLKNKTEVAGLHQISFKGFDLPSGIYFCTMYSDNFSDTKKMLLIK